MPTWSPSALASAAEKQMRQGGSAKGVCGVCWKVSRSHWIHSLLSFWRAVVSLSGLLARMYCGLELRGIGGRSSLASAACVLQDLRLEREMQAHHRLDEVEVRREGVEEETPLGRMYAVHGAWWAVKVSIERRKLWAKMCAGTCGPD